MVRPLGVTLLAGLLLCGVASASTVLQFGTEDMVRRAAIVAHGKVTRLQAREAIDGTILTDLELEVSEAFKGVRGDRFVFTVYGGVLGERGSAIAGAAQFVAGEEVVVFLSAANQRGVRATIGLAQGKYTIREVEGQRLAFRDLEGLRLVDAKGQTAAASGSDQGVPVGALLERIRAAVREAAAEKGR